MFCGLYYILLYSRKIKFLLRFDKIYHFLIFIVTFCVRSMHSVYVFNLKDIELLETRTFLYFVCKVEQLFPTHKLNENYVSLFHLHCYSRLQFR